MAKRTKQPAETRTPRPEVDKAIVRPNKKIPPRGKVPSSRQQPGSLFHSAAKKDKISTVIIRQIRSAIMQGKLKPGQALANEKELIEQFGVSKHTLREALRTLEGMGLISIKRGAGGGPVVSEIDIGTARDYFASFMFFQNVARDDITSLRRLAEPWIARTVAATATPEMIAELEQVHEECRVLVEQGTNLVGTEAEIMFHVQLARQTNNTLLWIIMDFINNMLAEIKIAIKPGHDFSVQVYKAHQRILDAIKAGNPIAAEKAMYDHICEVADGLDRIEEAQSSTHKRQTKP